MQRVRPGHGIQEIKIQLSMLLSEQVGHEVKVEVMLAHVLADKQCQKVIGLSRPEQIASGWRLQHVHDGKRRAPSQIFREAVLEADGGIAEAVCSGIRCNCEISKTQFKIG